MSLLVGDGISRDFQGNVVLHDLAFRLEEGDRTGLVGANGAGKTTLLRIIAGADDPTLGAVQRKRGLRTSYLPQEPPAWADVSLRQAVHEPFAELRRLEAALHEGAEALSHAPDPQAALARYSALQAEFEARGGYTYEARIQSVLTGLGFSEDQYDMPLAHLSGGQRTRALLGKLLLEEPELLLLDEPTNHLDLDAIEWVESWLRDFKGSLLVVSHDRWFLETVTHRIWDLTFGKLETYPGGYRSYLTLREERRLARERVYEQQQEFIRKTEDFIARNLAGQRSREAKGRRTRLQRFLATEAVDRPREQGTVNLRLDAAPRSGDRVLRTRDLLIGYDAAKPLARVPDLEVWRGERVAILGPNGNGKTTLLKTLLGEIEPLGGEVRCGASVEIGYLAQAHEGMDPEATVLETILAVRGERTIEQVRTILGAFLFHGEEVFKLLRELSVGQKSRVALVWLALQGVNTLLLDEPTNHLDIPSQEELQSVLKEYPGTILFVTHDRSLVQALATEVWCVEAGTVHVVRGGWAEYHAWRDARLLRARETSRSGARSDGLAQLEADREARRKKKEKERMRARCAEVEARIPEIEGRMKELGAQIDAAGTKQDMEALSRLCLDYQALERELKPLWDEWTRLTESLEA